MAAYQQIFGKLSLRDLKRTAKAVAEACYYLKSMGVFSQSSERRPQGRVLSVKPIARS
jgi:hypothetical protein